MAAARSRRSSPAGLVTPCANRSYLAPCVSRRRRLDLPFQQRARALLHASAGGCPGWVRHACIQPGRSISAPLSAHLAVTPWASSRFQYWLFENRTLLGITAATSQDKEWRRCSAFGSPAMIMITSLCAVLGGIARHSVAPVLFVSIQMGFRRSPESLRGAIHRSFGETSAARSARLRDRDLENIPRRRPIFPAFKDVIRLCLNLFLALRAAAGIFGERRRGKA